MDATLAMGVHRHNTGISSFEHARGEMEKAFCHLLLSMRVPEHPDSFYRDINS